MRKQHALTYLSAGFAVLFIFSALVFVNPAGVRAEQSSPSTYGPSFNRGLVPCGGATDSGGATGCQACDLVSLLQNLINFFLGLSIPIAIALFAYAGVLYFTSAANEGNISKAKGIFQSAFTGLLIALGAYLIVETVLHAVLSPAYFNGWNKIQCVKQIDRPTTARVDQLFGQAITTFLNGPPVTPGAPGTPTTITTIAPNGTPTILGFSPTRNVQEMGNTYLNVTGKYGSQINAACFNSPIPNCAQVVASVIVVESSGGAGSVSSAGATGLMQYVNSGCSASDTLCQINEGVNLLNRDYVQFGQNLPNTFAAYNSGNSTTPGQSPSGLNSGMVASVNCPGLYAYQCTINPGGLVETQGYVANICGLLTYETLGC